MIDIKNILIGFLTLVIGGLIYFGVVKDRAVANQNNLLVAAQDTLHTFKTVNGAQGAYISTLVGDKNGLIAILQLKNKSDVIYQKVIDSLKQDKNIQSVVVVTTETKSNYTHKIDTIYKDVNFKDSISTKWYDASIGVDKGLSKWKINTREELAMSNTLKPNKGLFSGKTLTTYATPANQDTKVTGITSISTVVDKRKPRLGIDVSTGLNTDIHGKNLRPGFQVGIGISF